MTMGPPESPCNNEIKRGLERTKPILQIAVEQYITENIMLVFSSNKITDLT